MNISTVKKYLLTSLLLILMSEKQFLFVKTFFGLECDNKSLTENLNREYNFKNLMPELVDKKEPPIITKIKKINDRFCGALSREIPMLDILLVNDKNIELKL